MAEISSIHVMVDREEILDAEGKIKTDVLPSNITGTQITVSPTPPPNPEVNSLWIDTSV